jgi:HTH-type transcriptional regulator / antitoxin HipB
MSTFNNIFLLSTIDNIATMSMIDNIGAPMLIRTPTDLGAVIRERRKQLGLDQAELAARIGVSRQWVIGIERRPPPAELGLMLRALDALGIRLNASTGPAPSSKISAGPDIDAIVASARKGDR